MQLLYPKPVDMLNTVTNMMNTHMLLPNQQIQQQVHQQQQHQQQQQQQQHQQQMFMKYGQTHPPINPYGLPMLTPSRMNCLGMDFRPRRRRNNHSLVATMDPVAVARRNERERNRVKQVNDGFDCLRKRVPFLPDKKKLSKVEILRYAMMYIRDLKGVVEEYDCNNFGKRKDSETSCSSLTTTDSGRSSGDEEHLETCVME